jgi:hypothetical protein
MKPVLSPRAWVPLGLAVFVLSLYYGYGWARANGYIFGAGETTFTTVSDSECLFMFFFIACATYVSVLVSLFLFYGDYDKKIWSMASDLLAHRFFPIAAVIAGFAAMVLVRLLLFERAPLTDDENVYVFVAKTLLAGRLKNPAPEFHQLFRHSLVIVDPQQWMGQYTIGHSLFLALGLSSGLLDLVIPLVSAGTLLLIYLIAKDHFGPRVATVALFLAALSPQFIFTGGTLLGYPTGAFCSALMVFSAFRFLSSRKWHWALLFFVASPLLVLNRPQTFVCLGIPLGVYLLAVSIDRRDRRSWGVIGLLLAIALASIGIFALANYVQTGDPLKTAQFQYLESWGGGGMRFRPLSGLVNFCLSMIRQNIWLLGWPFSFAFLLFISGRRFVFFLVGWGIAHSVFYLFFYSPGINITGPVYYYEMIVPEVILSAYGIVRLHGICRNYFGGSFGHGVVPTLVFSFYIGAFLMFWPVALASLRQIATDSSAIYRLLDEERAHNAIIFADTIVPDCCHTWAFFPYVSGPDLDGEDRIFVRWPESTDTMKAFLQKYPDRQVWGVRPEDKKGPTVWRMR